MSNAIFPTLVGLGWSVKRVPMWKTRVQEAISGKETRIADWSFPRWKWELAYDFLRGDAGHAEFQSLAGFFNQRQGVFDSFLYQDADDNGATAQLLGSGDGATRSFQLVRTLGGFIEPIIAPNAVNNNLSGGRRAEPVRLHRRQRQRHRHLRHRARGGGGRHRGFHLLFPLPLRRRQHGFREVHESALAREEARAYQSQIELGRER